LGVEDLVRRQSAALENPALGFVVIVILPDDCGEYVGSQ
jgi:hypothetical protein